MPVSTQIALTSGDSVSTTFQLKANSSELSGSVKLLNNDEMSNVKEATVRVTMLSTGQSYTKETNADGTFLFTEMPAGTYKVVASKDGFTSDSDTVVVAAGATITVG